MPTTWKTIRVFISSTFRDMHAERDHLVRVVFPEPWGIIAAARFAAAPGSKIAGNPKWSALILDIRTWFETQGQVPGK